MAQARGGFVGVDRGLATYLVAATEEGTEVARMDGLVPLKRSEVALQKADQRASHKRLRSKNRRRANARLALIHARVADQRRDFLHRVSSDLVKTHDQLCLEDLAVSHMVKNRHLSKAIADASWGRFAQMVTYKAAWYGTELIIAPRFFPSTKTCSACGWVWSEMGLKDRVFTCPQCGLVLDRDLSAAIDLAAWANAERASASRAPDPEARGRVTNACGGKGAGRRESWRCNRSRNRTEDPLEEAGTGSGLNLSRTPEKGGVRPIRARFYRIRCRKRERTHSGGLCVVVRHVVSLLP